MRLKIIGLLAAVLSVLTLSMTPAQAASSGTFAMARSDTTASGSYNFYGQAYNCNSAHTWCQYRVAISWKLTSYNGQDTHLNVKSDGYGYRQIARRTSSGTSSGTYYLPVGDVSVASSITVQLCRERLGADDCTTVKKYR